MPARNHERRSMAPGSGPRRFAGSVVGLGLLWIGACGWTPTAAFPVGQVDVNTREVIQRCFDADDCCPARRRCREGDVVVCNWLGAQLTLAPARKPETEVTRRLVEIGVDLLIHACRRDPASCQLSWYVAKAGCYNDHVAAKRAASIACDVGEIMGCLFYADYLHIGVAADPQADASDERRRAASLYAKLCDAPIDLGSLGEYGGKLDPQPYYYRVKACGRVERLIELGLFAGDEERPASTSASVFAELLAKEEQIYLSEKPLSEEDAQSLFEQLIDTDGILTMSAADYSRIRESGVRLCGPLASGGRPSFAEREAWRERMLPLMSSTCD